MLKQIEVLMLVVLLIEALSCKKEESTNVPIDSSISISGHVSPFDENENPIADSSGYLVIVQGTPLSMTTSSAGRWSLTATRQNPVLVFSKPGFATRWLTWGLHSGQNEIGEVRIGKNPTWNVTELQFFFDSTHVHIAGRVSSPAGQLDKFRNVILFLGDSRAISSNPLHFRLCYDKAKVRGPGTVFITPDGLDAHSLGVARGARLYVAAYGATPYFGVDSTSNPRPLFSGLSATAIVDSFIVP